MPETGRGEGYQDGPAANPKVLQARNQRRADREPRLSGESGTHCLLQQKALSIMPLPFCMTWIVLATYRF